ncbi:hypothetical protein HBI56_114440 [Parastagonospora nodorum]|uniref:Uncharacterized protein n=1 Tax=Phaeosphaeria nodorum (strain SN15 / ATCC MYA-4574 / FGSC 10173) TaxID=321614 RepID=A0A7U2I5W3_PHANO|nr:hypothetical protein HBH56_195290 [Parastagonospora nodorum]QRD00528.1 hypothetical protein JI435_415300 [Parastagonospora nodorum SN15]KAH3924951.1 hypothetical protein HBH54_188200 [Parastagonospora nodorum]KAH3952965.1 hypothetical protein HBH53_040350 [Parastagonospora nodorum]KAH3976419.1 hypothetical protein HBH52_118140 [Parastagonospora nodorum]
MKLLLHHRTQPTIRPALVPSRESTRVIYNTVTYSPHSRTARTPTDHVPTAPITTTSPYQPRSS